jgi:hypothetical protein
MVSKTAAPVDRRLQAIEAMLDRPINYWITVIRGNKLRCIGLDLFNQLRAELCLFFVCFLLYGCI